MTFGEFEAVMRGIALRNGVSPNAAPTDDDFFADLAKAMADGTA